MAGGLLLQLPRRNKTMYRILLAATAISICAAQPKEHSQSLAPYVPSAQAVVEMMLDSARLKPGELLYDLGSGDGRVVITAAQKYRARAVGVELSENLYRASTEKVKSMGLDTLVKIVHGNLLDVDLSPANVVTMYLLTNSNEKVKPNLEKYLKPGARVVSHDFIIRGWSPARVEKVQVDRREHTIYVYEIRAKK